MPELPEVETVVRGLRPLLLGRPIVRILAADRRVLRTPRARLNQLPGRSVAAVERLGKFIRICLSPGCRLHNGGADALVCPPDAQHPERSPSATGTAEGGCAPTGDVTDLLILTIHLGMAGRLLAVPADHPPEKHAYFRLLVHSELRIANSELRYVNPRWCMGGIWVNRPDDPKMPTSILGRDPLLIGEDEFVELLGRRRQIKALLLDQTMLAGVGNIYADESLFAAGIHPRAVAAKLSADRRHRLLDALRDRLCDAIRRGGSTIRDYRDATGQAGSFQLELKAYGRTGEPCVNCGSPIRHNITAGRSTHFCGKCQRR